MASFNADTCPLAIEAKKRKHKLHTVANRGPRDRAQRRKRIAPDPVFTLKQLKLYQWLRSRYVNHASLDNIEYKMCIHVI